MAKALQQKGQMSREKFGCESKSVVEGGIRKLPLPGQLEEHKVKISTLTYTCVFSKLICHSLINAKK